MMTQTRQPAWPNYLIAFTLAVLPIYDTILTVLPLRFSDARWRFATYGLIFNALILVSVGFLIALWVAQAFEHRTFRRALGVVAMVASVVIVIMLGLFALDVLQVRSGVREGANASFAFASTTAALKAILCAISLGGLGFGAFRTPKPTRAVAATRERPLMVGPAITLAAPAPGADSLGGTGIGATGPT